MTEDEMVGWHRQLNGQEFEQSLGERVEDRRAWCAAVHSHKDLMTEQKQLPKYSLKSPHFLKLTQQIATAHMSCPNHCT